MATDVVTIVWNRPAQTQTVTVTVPTAILQLLDWIAANEPNQHGQQYINAPNVLWSDVFALLVPRWMSLYQQGQMAAAQASVVSTMAGIQGSLAQGTVAGMPTYSISGTITGGAGATVTLSGASTATVTADASGNYSFSGLASGNYTVTASKAGFTIAPSNAAVTVNYANVTGINFTATALTYSISGTLTNGAGATVALSGAATATSTADASGNYSFSALVAGSYTVTPTLTGKTFTPVNATVTVSGSNVSGVNFTGA